MADEVKKIAHRIELTGEKEYNSALKEAQRNLKVLRSELKAETAELGKNATEQQKNETRLKNLQKQIKEQEKVVKTYEKALAEVRDKYGDNEEAIAKWEVKLNDARTALANMRNGLEDTGKSLRQMGTDAQASAQMGIVAANSFADSLGKIADAGGAISGALETAFKNIAGMIGDTVRQVWEGVVDLAARSNNLVDLAGFWNTDVTKIQKWQGAVAYASASLEDLNGIVTRINAGDAKKITELTGISDVNFQDKWEYAMAVMDAMSKMTAGKRNEVGFDLFGKGATKAFDLLNDWEEIREKLDANDVTKGGYGLTEEQLNNMSDLYDKVNGIRYSWQALKDMATVELFGKVAMEVTGNIQNILDAFKDYFNAETDGEREEALKKVRENIVEAFKNIVQAINDGIAMLDDLADELQNSDDATAQALGKVLQGIVDALEWFTKPENWEKVKKGFEAIIGIWVTGNIAKALGNMASFAAHIATIKSGGLFGGILGKLFGGGNSTSSYTPNVNPNINATPKGTPVTAGGGAGIEWLSGAAQGIIKIATNLGMYDPTGLTALIPTVLGDRTAAGRVLRDGGSIGDALNASMDVLKKNFNGDTIAKSAEAAANYWTNDLPNAFWGIFGFNSKDDAAKQVGDAIIETLSQTKRNIETAGQYTFGDDMTAEEAMAMFQAEEEAAKKQEELHSMLIDLLQNGSKIPGFGEMHDLPADWWNGSGGITSDDLNGLRTIPGAVGKSIRENMSGIRVYMDKEQVGYLIAPYVSQQIARETYP